MIDLLTFCLCWSICRTKPLTRSRGLTTAEMISNYNYPVETHYIQTEDGYILQIHRIPYGIKLKTFDRKGSMLLMHGLLSSSADWINMGPDRSLGYILADLGYDVWIGNARGNLYSRNHITMNPDTSSEFWDFSWHEIGYYDLPAMIDYMLDKTGDENCYYMGHSQGTTSLLVLLTTKVEYNAKIKLASLMGTAAFMQNTMEFGRTLAQILDPLVELFNSRKIFEMALNIVRDFGMQNCDNPEFQPLCIRMFNLVGGGNDTAQIDLGMLTTILSNAPAGAAIKQFYHFLQLIKNGGFRQYDLGIEGNLNKYGSETPPEYDLSLVTAPVAIYSGLNDGLVNYQDSNLVADKVSNLVENYLIPYELFNHVDFLFAKDVVELFYNKLLSDLAEF